MFEIYIGDLLVCNLHEFDVAIRGAKMLARSVPNYLVEIRENNVVIFRTYTVEEC
jgi:hypothetical protein